MFKIAIDYSDLITTMQDQVESMIEIAKPYNQEQMAKAVFTISAKEFIRKMNKMALAAQKSLHHVYEWGHIGEDKYRLFEIRRTQVGGGNLYVSAYFLPSKSRVPIPANLRIPGRHGKIVRSSSVFINKASVMESGNPTRPFSAKKAKALAFQGKDGRIVFIRRPIRISIKNPGGRYTTGAFTRRFVAWFENAENINLALRKSGYVKALEKGIAAALEANKKPKTAVNLAIREISGRYSMGQVIV